MSFLSKTLLVSTLFVSSIYANSIDDKVLQFEKNRFSNNKRVEIKNLSINLKKSLPVKQWYGFIIDVEAKIADKQIKAKDIIFSNGEVVAPDLFDINTGNSLKELMTPTLTNKYYDEKRLIAGNHNAKDKIVIFSDPLCPFCLDYVPDIIRYVKKNKKNVALYYYHFPLLQIHQAANALSKAMLVASKKGVKDVTLKVYEADFEQYFEADETDEKKILNAFNKVIKTNITLDEIQNKDILKEIATDITMGEDVLVQGTPTIFVNGEQDKTKNRYKQVGK
ncbi:disulfide bond formation protein DsbA [Malaciobacter halophilus]|uniref:Disulfide bond formation protein DsbA n=1 Tax=Malaciobacter halophilus TaxID=197482 RepID=A0A2N1J2W2_9BACT|nr:thioredoxin domain-containing protein [Malaciobacter halophilus]AXH10663.1 protein disulfide isomerase [Malaciobacter halophilus]PKI80895.1 disulfide bond formation protein DsbA [Malaciobacter halophilus]